VSLGFFSDNQGFLLGDKGGRCVGLTTLPLTLANCLEILGASNCWSRNACPGVHRNGFTYNHHTSWRRLCISSFLRRAFTPICFLH